MTTTAFIPKYKKIKKNLLAEIKSGKLNPGDKLPVREKLVVKYNSTRATVDKAVNELVKDNILTASRRNGTFVAASHKQLQKIAIVSWEQPIKANIQKYGDRYNYYNMFWMLMIRLKDRKCELIEKQDALRNPAALEKFDKVILNMFSLEEVEKVAQYIGKEKIFLLNRYYPDYRFASTNHYKAAKEITELFLSNLPKESKVYFIDCNYNFVVDERRRGFVDACSERQKFYRLIRFTSDDYGCWTTESLKEIDTSHKEPVVLISPTARVTGIAMRFAAENGFRFNEDFFYSDFDNNDSLGNTGYIIPSVLEDFAEIANFTLNNIETTEPLKKFIPHKIINNPFNIDNELKGNMLEKANGF